MPQSQIADHPSAPQGRDTDHRHNYSKATSFLFRSKMITKLEGTPKPHHERRTKYNPHTLWEQQQQQQQKYNVLLSKTRKESAALNGYQPRQPRCLYGTGQLFAQRNNQIKLEYYEVLLNHRQSEIRKKIKLSHGTAKYKY